MPMINAANISASYSLITISDLKLDSELVRHFDAVDGHAVEQQQRHETCQCKRERVTRHRPVHDGEVEDDTCQYRCANPRDESE